MSVPTSEAVHQSRIAPADNKFHVGNGEDGKHLRGELAKLDAVFDTVPLFIGGHAFHSFTVADLKAALSAPVALEAPALIQEIAEAQGWAGDDIRWADLWKRIQAAARSMNARTKP